MNGAGRPRLAAGSLLGLALGLAASSRGTGTPMVTVLSETAATRTVGLAGAGVAVGDDETLVWLTPAAAAECRRVSITAAGHRSFFGDLNGQLQAAIPRPAGAFVFGLAYDDAGSGLLFDSSGGSRRISLQQDLMGTATYARRISPAVTAGATLKCMRSTLLEERSATQLAGDLGVQAGLGSEISVGGAVRNAGTALRYLNDSSPAPTVATAGAAASWPRGSADRVLGLVDVEYAMANARTALTGGAEYRYHGLLAVRAGARWANRAELGLYAAGFTLAVNRYRLDLALRFSRYFSNPESASFTIAFP